MTNTKTFRTAFFSIVALGSSLTGAVEAAAIVGTVAMVPVAMHMGVGSGSALSAVAQAHAVKLARAEQAQAVNNLAHVAKAAVKAAA